MYFKIQHAYIVNRLSTSTKGPKTVPNPPQPRIRRKYNCFFAFFAALCCRAGNFAHITTQHYCWLMQKRFILVCCAWCAACFLLHAQLTLPRPATNLKSMAGREVGLTEIEIHWSAPGVKGREGKIWGTDIAHYGFKVLGFGSNTPSPWRAGANENTTIRFSTAVP